MSIYMFVLIWLLLAIVGGAMGNWLLNIPVKTGFGVAGIVVILVTLAYWELSRRLK